MIKKSITFSIILLFIGVSISSGISIDTETIEVEDCKECNKVDNADLIKVERLLDRVEVYSKLLLVLSKHYPELKEISEELSNTEDICWTLWVLIDLVLGIDMAIFIPIMLVLMFLWNVFDCQYVP
jgi:hypothetical protein